VKHSGIIFTGGLRPSSQIIKQLLQTELSAQAEKPLFIAADSGLTAAEDAGIKPHWIIGDMDSLENQSRLAAYPPECVIRHQQDKDHTDTELAFFLAIEKGCDYFWIIGGGGGRIDHLFAIRSMFERDVFPHRWITDNADIYCIDAVSNVSLTLKKEQSAVVSVFPLGNGPWEAESTGLKWPLADLPWDRGFFGLSNIAVKGEFSITAKHGRFMVVLSL
jgi:thiamine pyrophosphokinase